MSGGGKNEGAAIALGEPPDAASALLTDASEIREVVVGLAESSGPDRED
jgi:hypothetical protein